MASSRKRPRPVVALTDLTDADHPINSASLDGTLLSLSPIMKTQKSWFDGSLTDGTTKLRIVGLHPHVHKKLDSLFQQQKPVHLDDCQVKESRLDDNKMDVMLKSWTEVTPSTKTIEIAS